MCTIRHICVLSPIAECGIAKCEIWYSYVLSIVAEPNIINKRDKTFLISYLLKLKFGIIEMSDYICILMSYLLQLSLI